jgi:hypothetical protein
VSGSNEQGTFYFFPFTFYLASLLLFTFYLLFVLSGCEQEPDDTAANPPVISAWAKVPDVPGQMPGEIQTVCYGNGVFVAGSRENDGRIAYSSDGVNWTGLDSTTTTFGTNFVHVRFLKGQFWAVGGGGHMAYSENGSSWTKVASPGITGNIVDIAWGDVPGRENGVFVAVGNAAAMSYSTDNGVTWTANEQPKQYFKSTNVNPADFKAIGWGGGKFLAAGQLCRAVYSMDGITWTNISDAIAKNVFSLKEPPQSGAGWFGMSVATYEAGLYIVATQGRLGLSPDCVNWECIDLEDAGFPSGHRWGWVNCLIYADGLFILGGGDGGSAWSADCRNWTRMEETNSIFHNFHFINGLSCANGKLVAVGATCLDPACPNNPKSDKENDHAGNAGCIAYASFE